MRRSRRPTKRSASGMPDRPRSARGKCDTGIDTDAAQSATELRQHLEVGRPWLDPMTWELVVELETERDRYRELLIEFESHRADSSLVWFDEWSRRVSLALDQERRDD